MKNHFSLNSTHKLSLLTAGLVSATLLTTGCMNPNQFGSAPLLSKDTNGAEQPAPPSDPSDQTSTPPTDNSSPGVPGSPGSPSVPKPVLLGAESFVQSDSAGKIDILIINDNSASMDLEQQKMAERFGSFISALGEVDYQIAMTTTDISRSSRFAKHGSIVEWEGAGTAILTSKTPNSNAVFKETIRRKESIGCEKSPAGCPSGDEQPLAALRMAIDKRDRENKMFFRPNVDLAVVVLSDEDEYSDGSSRAVKPLDVISTFQNAFGQSKKLSVHGLVVIPEDYACKQEQEVLAPAFFGTHVAELARLTGGSLGSICEQDYSQNLASISNQVRDLISSFELKHAPGPDTVRVTLDPHADISFRVEGKKVIFSTPPPAGTKIGISYLY